MKKALIKKGRGSYFYKGFEIYSDRYLWSNPKLNQATFGSGNWYIVKDGKTQFSRTTLDHCTNLIDFVVKEAISFK